MRDRWKGETCVIVASGPSLTDADIEHAVSRRVRMIAINESWVKASSADVLYGADAGWWRIRKPLPGDFKGEYWTQNRGWNPQRVPDDIHCIESRGGNVIDPTQSYIHDGGNSAFQSLGLAILWGCRRVVFLGLDLGYTRGLAHWHGEHIAPLHNPSLPLLAFCRNEFAIAAPQCAALGVRVINASRETTLNCFERMGIEDALS